MDRVGNLLYTERRKKGLEIADIEQATGIRAAYIKALEEDRYDVLPGEVYVKGFIRNYGNHLGLDGAHLVHMYGDSMVESHPQPSIVPTSKKKDFPLRLPGKKMISAIVVGFLLVASVWSLYEWSKGNPAKVPASRVETTAAKSLATNLPASSGTVPSSTAQLVTNARAVVLVAHYTDRCWTSAIADGKTIYEGIPQSGETLTWEADRQIIVNFGNAAAVELSFNGQPVGKVGERGDVVVKTFSAPASPVVKP